LITSDTRPGFEIKRSFEIPTSCPMVST
jgi:hypothetical protein